MFVLTKVDKFSQYYEAKWEVLLMIFIIIVFSFLAARISTRMVNIRLFFG